MTTSFYFYLLQDLVDRILFVLSDDQGRWSYVSFSFLKMVKFSYSFVGHVFFLISFFLFLLVIFIEVHIGYVLDNFHYYEVH